MKYAMSLIAIIALFVAGFGFMTTDNRIGTMHLAHGNGMEIADCSIVAIALQAPGNGSMAAHHLAAYYTFLNTPTSAFFIFALLACALLLGYLAQLFFVQRKLILVPLYVYDRLRYSSYSDASLKQQFSTWLSLFENSPTFT